jgi:hypothetical protein
VTCSIHNQQALRQDPADGVCLHFLTAVCSVGYYNIDTYVDPVAASPITCTKCPNGATTKTVGSDDITDCGKQADM